MVIIRPTRLHWIKDDGSDDPNDFCAHSPVEMIVDGTQWVSPDDGDWAVSASALLLLRSIFSDHPGDMRSEEHIFPCCGHSMLPMQDGRVFIGGCPNGIDFRIIHTNSEVFLAREERSYSLPKATWREVVLGFAYEVYAFYESSKPKNLSLGSDPDGYVAMMTEWRELTTKAQPQR
jgi:hypothetical protein